MYFEKNTGDSFDTISYYMEKKKPFKKFTIKDWAADDQPRQKLLVKGHRSLSDAELIAVIIGSGSRRKSAVELAKDILRFADNDLEKLGRIPVERIMTSFEGVGEAKAVAIVAAMEIGRRRQLDGRKQNIIIQSSLTAYSVIGPLLKDLNHEEFWIICLSQANEVIAKDCISQGGQAGTLVDAKKVFRRALLQQAASIILVHNHPSGNLQPSQADKQLTEKLKAAGKSIDVRVLDHLIIAGDEYFSFADEGIF